MIFMQYIRPNAYKKLITIKLNPTYELVVDELMSRKIEFTIEHVPQYRKLFLIAQHRENGEIEQDAVLVASENDLAHAVYTLIDETVENTLSK